MSTDPHPEYWERFRRKRRAPSRAWDPEQDDHGIPWESIEALSDQVANGATGIVTGSEPLEDIGVQESVNSS